MHKESGAADRHVLWILAVGIPAIVFASLYWNPGLDPITAAPEQHFYIVSLASVACFALAVVAIRSTLEARSGRIYLMAIGFLLMSGMFAVHGLATPGYIVDARYFVVTGFSARMAIWFGACFLFLSAVPMPPTLAAAMIKTRYQVFAAIGTALVVYFALALMYPESVPPRIMSARLFLDGTLVSVVGFTAVAAVAYARLYLRTRAPVYGAVAVGAVLLFEAQVAMHYGELWRWSWWMYHLQMLGAFVTMLSFPFAGRSVESRTARLPVDMAAGERAAA